jgi:glutaredoxin
MHLVMYTRAGCHLCDDARRTLEDARRVYEFDLQTVDVDTSAELVREYGDWVPVVTIDGVVKFRGRVNRVLLERTLQVRT